MARRSAVGGVQWGAMAEPTPPPPTDADPEATLPRMTLGEHLDELRRRVGRSVLAVVIATIAAFCFNDALWTQAVAPYNEAMAGAGASGSLQTLSPLDGFIQPFKLAFIVAIVVSSPYVLWQMWGFIAAGLYVHEKKAVRVFFPASLVLFAAGVATAFLVVLPVGLRFLIGFGQSHGMGSSFAVGEYLSLGLSLLFGLGIAYQLPIVMVFLQAMGIVERETLRKGWRVAVLTAFVLAMVNYEGLTGTVEIDGNGEGLDTLVGLHRDAAFRRQIQAVDQVGQHGRATFQVAPGVAQRHGTVGRLDGGLIQIVREGRAQGDPQVVVLHVRAWRGTSLSSPKTRRWTPDHQSSLAPEPLTTSAQRLISLLTKRPKSSPHRLGVSVPRPVHMVLRSSAFSALRISACMAVVASRGLPLGAQMPYQVATL